MFKYWINSVQSFCRLFVLFSLSLSCSSILALLIVFRCHFVIDRQLIPLKKISSLLFFLSSFVFKCRRNEENNQGVRRCVSTCQCTYIKRRREISNITSALARRSLLFDEAKKRIIHFQIILHWARIEWWYWHITSQSSLQSKRI